MSLQQLTSQSVCKVQKMGTTTPDAAGGWTPVWVDLFSPVYARIEVASAARIEQFARQEMNVTHEVFTTQAGITVGMRVLSKGVAYLVQGNISEPATGRIPTYFHFLAEEQKPLNAVAPIS